MIYTLGSEYTSTSVGRSSREPWGFTDLGIALGSVNKTGIVDGRGRLTAIRVTTTNTRIIGTKYGTINKGKKFVICARSGRGGA
jgi:hypothetical protein